MKTLLAALTILTVVFSLVLLSGWGEMFYRTSKQTARIRALEYQHTRDSLVNDALKSNNTDLRVENGRLWSQVDKESGELVKGD